VNRLDTARRAQVIKCLAEGVSLRGTARLTGVARMTVEKLLRDIGKACAEFHDRAVQNLNSERVQVDEIWSFCYAKKKSIKKAPTILERYADAGDVWTWTAIDADSKLVVSWLVANRDSHAAYAILSDVAARMSNRIQLTTDQLSIYLRSVDRTFGVNVDYAMLHKIYAGGGDGRHSPAECIGTKKIVVTGDPDPKHISTSYVERQNLTMRMQMRRFTRLTNAFSKKVEMHAAAVALHFVWYNFVQIHGSLRVTPAMAAGVSDRVWEAEDVIALLGQ
jgi:IS1 family transposase